MDRILIQDLEVFCRVGVTEEERAQPQRLLLVVEMHHDFGPAAAADDLGRTIDYSGVVRDLLDLAETGSWNLIETVAAEMAGLILAKYRPAKVGVELKKFILPQTRYVSVSVVRGAAGSP